MGRESVIIERTGYDKCRELPSLWRFAIPTHPSSQIGSLQLPLSQSDKTSHLKQTFFSGGNFKFPIFSSAKLQIRLNNISLVASEQSSSGKFGETKSLRRGGAIYTSKGGWLDMTHFMFYAGKAYNYRLQKESAQKLLKENSAYLGESYLYVYRQANIDPVEETIKDGYHQESSDRIASKHSAYSYEDLPTDKLGAIFGAQYFNPNSKLSFGEQLKNYLETLGVPPP